MSRNSYLWIVVVIALLWGSMGRARPSTAEEQAALTLYRQGLILEKQEKYKKALNLVKKAYLILPNRYVIFNLAFLYFRLGDCKAMETYLNELDMSKLPVKARKKAGTMRFHCEFKALGKVTGVAGVIELARLYDAAPDAQAKKDIKKRITGVVNGPGFKPDVIAHLGDLDAALWQAMEKTLGPGTTGLIRHALLTEIADNAFMNQDKDLAAKAVMELAGYFIHAGTKPECPWEGTALNDLAACTAYNTGLRAFNAGRFKPALFAFHIADSIAAHARTRVYEGLCLLHLGSVREAAETLEPVQDQAISMGFGLLRDAMAVFHLNSPEQVIKAAKVLSECKKGASNCMHDLDPLIRAGVLKPCVLARYFKAQPDLFGSLQEHCLPRPIAKRHTVKAARAARPAAIVTRKPPRRRSYRTGAWVTAGASAALLGTGIALLVIAESRIKGLKSAPDLTYSQTDLSSRLDSVHNLRVSGWVCAGAGAAAAIASIVLFAIEPKSRAHISAFGLPGGAGLSVFTEF